jgi:1-acyl-sn-glycerol-3-phosphate acyltransferase
VGYRLVRALARALLELFYRRIDVVGAERLPETGPLIVAANHHNSVVDAMLLVAVSPRRLRTLANAPLFRHPFVGPFLRLIGALPVQRRQEAGDDPAKNAALFAATTETLRQGGAILIFPEGRTQPEPVLLELRTGAARMLLAAEAAGGAPPVTLLPVGLVYHEPGTFRDGRALVSIGAPVRTDDAVSLARTEPERAARQLTERLREGLKAEIVEADDRATLRLVGLAEELWQLEHPQAHARDEKARVLWLQAAMSRYQSLLQEDPARIHAFRQQLEEYDQEQRRAGLVPAAPRRRYPTAAAAIKEGMLLLLGAPLALAGMAAHAIPYQLTELVVRKLDRTAEEEATDKIAAGFVLYPLAWAVEALVIWKLAGGWAAAAFLAALLPTGFFALAWRERLARLQAEARAFVAFMKDEDLPRRLGERQRRLVTELQELAGLTTEGRRP